MQRRVKMAIILRRTRLLLALGITFFLLRLLDNNKVSNTTTLISLAHVRTYTPAPTRPELPPGMMVEIVSRGRPVARDVACDVGCRWSTRSSSIVDVYEVLHSPLRIKFSMEGPQYYPTLRVRDNADMALATTSWDAEVPVPHVSNADEIVGNAGPPILNAKSGATFIAHNCASRNNREDYVRELMQHFPIAALGPCLHNSDSPPSTKADNWGQAKIDMMQSRAVHLAFENQNEDDYITEKAWLALWSGVLPVYMGAPNAAKLLPSGSVVLVNDFESPRALAEHLRYLERNETALLEYHAWRSKPLEAHLRKLYMPTNDHVECRMCRWAATRMLNLTWDHRQQRPSSPYG